MKTAARRASRRLTVLPGTLELLHRHVDRLDLDVAHPDERVGDPFLHGRRDLRQDAAVHDGELELGASSAVLNLDAEPPRPLRNRAPSTDATARRTISVSAASLTRTEPLLSCTSTRLKSRPGSAAARRPPQGMTSSTRRCGTRRLSRSPAAPRASSGTPTISNSVNARKAPARSPARRLPSFTISFAISES